MFVAGLTVQCGGCIFVICRLQEGHLILACHLIPTAPLFWNLLWCVLAWLCAKYLSTQCKFPIVETPPQSLETQSKLSPTLTIQTNLVSPPECRRRHLSLRLILSYVIAPKSELAPCPDVSIHSCLAALSRIPASLSSHFD